MSWYGNPSSCWVLRPIGATLLLIAWRAALCLFAIGPVHAGDEPPRVYLLALLAFACASSGAALLIHGRHLLDRVRVSEHRDIPVPHGAAQPDRDGLSDREQGPAAPESSRG